jgi:hypothetical protein
MNGVNCVSATPQKTLREASLGVFHATYCSRGLLRARHPAPSHSRGHASHAIPALSSATCRCSRRASTGDRVWLGSERASLLEPRAAHRAGSVRASSCDGASPRQTREISGRARRSIGRNHPARQSQCRHSGDGVDVVLNTGPGTSAGRGTSRSETVGAVSVCRARSFTRCKCRVVAGSPHACVDADRGWVPSESPDRRVGTPVRFSDRTNTHRLYERSQGDDVHV